MVRVSFRDTGPGLSERGQGAPLRAVLLDEDDGDGVGARDLPEPLARDGRRSDAREPARGPGRPGDALFQTGVRTDAVEEGAGRGPRDGRCAGAARVCEPAPGSLYFELSSSVWPHAFLGKNYDADSFDSARVSALFSPPGGEGPERVRDDRLSLSPRASLWPVSSSWPWAGGALGAIGGDPSEEYRFGSRGSSTAAGETGTRTRRRSPTGSASSRNAPGSRRTPRKRSSASWTRTSGRTRFFI